MRLMFGRLAALLLASCVSCSSGIQSVSGASDSAFAGTWVQREAVGGTSLVLTLTVSGTKVTGTGTYVENGKSGSLSQSGEVSGDRVELAMTFDNGSEAQFDGEINNSSVLNGALHLGPRKSLTASAIVAFDKKE